jgi:hypothetical protein
MEDKPSKLLASPSKTCYMYSTLPKLPPRKATASYTPFPLEAVSRNMSVPSRQTRFSISRDGSEEHCRHEAICAI